VISHFNSIEEIIADEHFAAWYYKTDLAKAAVWENWLRENGAFKQMAEEAAALLGELSLREQPVASSKIEAAYERFNAGMEEAPIVTIRPAKRRWWLSAAAAILLISGAAFLWSNNSKHKVIESAYGQIKEYSLPDGSQVTLNANSEVELGKGWEEGKEREVWLKGEAFFRVQKTAHKSRFIVHTKAMDIVVTGTQFNAIARDDESSVLLTEGSVTLLTAEGEQIKMQPGDFVKLHNNRPVKETVNEQKVLAWKQSKLVFENTTMKEVARVITKHYGIRVSIPEKEMGEKKISGVMPNDSLDVLLNALEATGEFRIQRAPGEVTISRP
jgi:ferric-dicitrate binding protein FerR (iron transport regulator)